MRKRLSLIALLFISLFSACSDDSGTAAYKCTECVDEPEANAAYDNNGQGIYKGVIIGSSGTIKFDIANDGTNITAVLVIDGTSVTLTASGFYEPGIGFQGTFTGSLNGGSVIIPFSVNTSGGAVIGTPTIPGHPDVMITIFKEKSTQLVQGFEGTFTGDDSGTFNLIMIRNNDGVGNWAVIARSDDDSYFYGEVEENQLVGGGGGFIIVGEVGGDNMSGSWEYVVNGTSAANGTWTGKRTL